MKFLVTGATGFVGGAVTRHLLQAGHSVRALVRPESQNRIPSGNAADRIEPITGDLENQSSLRTAVEGVDGVFHVAAVYSYWHRNPSQTYRVNVDGTERLFRAAKAASVPRVVLTSTVATLKWPGAGKIADESAVASVDDLPGHYKRSKLMAEQTALALSDTGFEVVVTNPTAPFGPGDARPTPTGRIVLEFLNRRFPGYVNTAVNVADIEDVAAGHLLAFEKGKAKERYILGSENLTLREIYDLLASVTRLRRTPIRVPFGFALAIGAVDTLIEGKLLRREPYIPVEGLKVARHPMLVNTQKAVIELGLPTRPATESLLRSATWFASHDYTKATIATPETPQSEDEVNAGA